MSTSTETSGGNIFTGFGMDREYPNDYKGKLGQGDWRKSDRKNNTSVWRIANKYNLQQMNGFLEYNTITERTAFYLWFQNETESRGYETKWAGAAFIVADQMTGTENSLLNWAMSSEIKKFAQDGNKAIFNNVFSRLRELYNGQELKGKSAKNWDIETLTIEQRNIVDPIYKKQSEETLNTLSEMAKGQGVYQLGVPQSLKFRASDNIRNWEHRFNHGMQKSVPAWERYKNSIVVPTIQRLP